MKGLRLWAAALLTLALLLSAHTARAHASLVSSEPADGASLEAAPAALVLRFDEAVEPVRIRVMDSDGRAVPLGPIRAEGNNLNVAVPRPLGHGSYLLSYRVTSADSHPVAGTAAFSIGAMSLHRSVAPVSELATFSLFLIVLRALRDLALLVAVGAAVFVLVVTPFPGQKPTLVIAGAAAAVLSLLSIGVQGSLLLGGAAVLAFEPWRIAIQTSFGFSAVLAAAGSAVIVVGQRPTRGRLSRGLLELGSLACIASLTLTGHAATAHPRWLAAGLIGAHGLGAAFWAGSLVALLALLRRESAQAVPALQRFSSLALAAVATLLAAGIGFACLQLASFEALWDTPYGRLVLVKAALLAVLLAFAATNRLVLLPRLIEGNGKAAASLLRRSISAEIVVVVAVLTATAALVQTSPHTGPLVRTLNANGRTAMLSLDPGRSGFNSITAALRDAQNGPLEAVAVELELSNPTIGIEPIRRPMVRIAAGRYHYEGSELALAGAWQLGIRARIDDFDLVVWSTELMLRR